MSVPLLGQVLAMLGQVAASLGTAITNIAGVQGTANTIRTDITSARDNINTTTNNARDNVKTHVSTTVANLALRAPVKSVQSGVVLFSSSATSASVTISAVNPAACVVTPGLHVVDANGISGVYSSHTLTATTLTIVRTSATSTGRMSWSIVEYNTSLG